MNTKYKMLLFESKKLNGSGLFQRASANNITADPILYDYAIHMVCIDIVWSPSFSTEIPFVNLI